MINSHIKHNRNGALDTLKGIAIILVVLRHIIQANAIDCDTNFISNCIFAVQMPIFMIIAGFFSITREEYYSNIENTAVYIKKRAIHYLLPFFSWFVIVQVLIFGKHERNIVIGLLYLSKNVDVGLWFLYVIFVLSTLLIFSRWFIYRISELNFWAQEIISYFLMGLLMMPLLVIGVLFGVRTFGVNLIIYYSFYFLIGRFVFCLKNYHALNIYPKPKEKMIFCFCIIVFLCLSVKYDFALLGDSIFEIIIRVIAALTGSATITFFALWFSKTKGALITETIGRYTLEIYTTHLYFIGLIGNEKYALFSLDGQKQFWLALAITSILSCIAINIINVIKPLKLLLFGRK